MTGDVIPHPTSDPLAHISYFASVVIAMTPIVVGFWAGWRRHERKKATKFDAHVIKIDALHDAIVGSEPTLATPNPAPGLLQRMGSVEGDLIGLKNAVDDVKREVTPNGGDTNRIGDRVKRLEERLNGS